MMHGRWEQHRPRDETDIGTSLLAHQSHQLAEMIQSCEYICQTIQLQPQIARRHPSSRPTSVVPQDSKWPPPPRTSVCTSGISEC